MGAAAIDVAITLNHVGALTVEFFYIPGNSREFYFNEINSRLQVEHCITELATSFDLVQEQINLGVLFLNFHSSPRNFSEEEVIFANQLGITA